MNIASLLNNAPSLANYLNKDGRELSAQLNQNFTQKTNKTLQALSNSQSTNSAYSLDLSPEAQRLMAQNQTGDNSGNPIKSAQNHFISFFDRGGLDLNILSDETSELIGGIVDFLGQSGTTARDTRTDALEMEYSKGDRDVFTLTGDSRRIRIAIEKDATGQNLLTVTDLNGNTADIAQMRIDENENGKPIITVTRSQEVFANGSRIGREVNEPITIKV